MHWRVLGVVEATDDSGRRLELGGPKQLSVLCLLMINAGRVVDTDRLTEELWPEEQPDAGRKTVQAYVARLRGALGDSAGRIRSARSGYVFESATDEIDAVGFERQTRKAQALSDTEPAAAAALLRDALGQWRGRPFQDAHPTPSLEAEAHRFEEMRLSAIECLFSNELACGRSAEVLPDLEREAGTHPLRESLQALHARALYQCGRQTEALRSLGEVRHRLRDELGVDPGRDLQELERLILEQAGSLEPTHLAPDVLGQPAPSHRRLGRWLSVVTVVAVALAAVVTIALRLGDGGPGGLGVSERHLLPPGSSAAVAAGGAIWVLISDTPELARFDPATGDISSHSLPHQPSVIGSGLGSVWLLSEEAGTVMKIDPFDGRVVAEQDGLDLAGASIAVGSDAVWVVSEHAEPFLRVDASDLSVTPIAFSDPLLPSEPKLAADLEVLWGANSDIGRVMWIDPQTGEAGLSGDARLGSHPARSILVDRGAVWFSQPTNGSISRIDAGSRLVTATVDVGKQTGSGFASHREPYGLAAGPGGVWATLPEDGEVVVLDDDTGEVSARVRLGRPVAVIALDRGVWVLDARLEQLARIDVEICSALPFIGPGADLRGCDLSDSALIGVDVTGADLRWMTVGLTPMQGVDLTDADLRGTDLTQSYLTKAVWDRTRCPDGSLSDDHGGTCVGHLAP